MAGIEIDARRDQFLGRMVRVITTTAELLRCRKVACICANPGDLWYRIAADSLKTGDRNQIA